MTMRACPVRPLRAGFLFALGLLAWAGCQAGSPAAPAPPAAPVQWSGTQSAAEAASHRVLRNAAAWAAFWQEVGQPPPRAFDPAREMGIAVFLGERRTGGYTVRIVAAAPRDGAFVVTCEESRPPPGTLVTQALTYPWALAVVPRSALPVRVAPAVAPSIRPAQK